MNDLIERLAKDNNVKCLHLIEKLQNSVIELQCLFIELAQSYYDRQEKQLEQNIKVINNLQ